MDTCDCCSFWLLQCSAEEEDYLVTAWLPLRRACSVRHSSLKGRFHGPRCATNQELRAPRPATTRVTRALHTRSVPEIVPKNGVIRGSVPRSVSGSLGATGSGVSRKCPEPPERQHVQGHFWTIRELTAPSDARFRGHSRGHFGPEKPERLL